MSAAQPLYPPFTPCIGPQLSPQSSSSSSPYRARTADFPSAAELAKAGRSTTTVLFKALTTARVTKSARELDCMWYGHTPSHPNPHIITS